MAAFSGLWRGIPDIVVRFPVPLLIAAGGLALQVGPSYPPPAERVGFPVAITAVNLGKDEVWALALTCFIAATAAVLFAEGRGWRMWPRLLLSAGVASMVGLILVFPAVTQPSNSLLSIAGFCAMLLAPFGLRAADRADFWWHAARVTGGAGTAILGALLLIFGGTLVEGAVRGLFFSRQPGVMPPYVMAYLVPVAIGFVAPLLWLTRIPAPGSAEAQIRSALHASLTVSRWVAVPLLFTYGVVLIAYAARIAWLGSVPSGQIGRYVPAFGVMGTIVFMMLQRERGQGRRLVDVFSALWFPLLVAPLGLLAAALWLRIEPFGFTAQRGHLLLVAAWLALITLLFAPRLGRGDLRLIPGVLLVLSLVFCAGPLGIVAIANRDQAGRLVDLLAAQGLVVDGRLVADATRKLDMRQTAQAQSIVRYLGSNNGLGALAPIFAGRDDDPFQRAERPAQADIEMRITGFPRDAGRAAASPDPRLTVTVKAAPAVLVSAGDTRVLGPFEVGFGRSQTVSTVDGITTRVEDNAVLVNAADGRVARFDLAAAIQAQEGEAVGRPPRIEGPVRITAPFGAARVSLVLQGAVLSSTRAATTVRGGTYFLVFTPAP